jgi:Rrf2 family protein
LTRSSHPSRYALPGVVVPAQLDYAIRGLVSLALAKEPRTKIDVLAAEHGLSRKFLAQVLVTLRDTGIVSTHRGSEGGYSLIRSPKSVRIVEVFDALSPGTGYQPRTLEGAASPAGVATETAWTDIACAIRAALERLTLADLVAPALRDRDDAAALLP